MGRTRHRRTTVHPRDHSGHSSLWSGKTREETVSRGSVAITTVFSMPTEREKKVYMQRRRLIPDDRVYPESVQPLKVTVKQYSTSYYHRETRILIYSHLLEDESQNFETYLA